MTWDEYRDAYLDVAIALQQSRLIACAAQEVLADYPASLSKNTRSALVGAFSRMYGFLAGKTVAKEHMGTAYTPLFHPTLYLLRFLGHRLSDPSDVAGAFDLLRTGSKGAVFAQQLALTIAHVDAFMGDTLRAICSQRPAVLKSKKQVTWETLVDLGQWEAVLSHLTEELVYEFGWSSIEERLDSFTERYGLDLTAVTKHDLETLAFGAQVRHLIMHNGGRVTARFCREVPAEKRQPIGEVLLVTDTMAETITWSALAVAGELCFAVGREYYRKTAEEMKDVVRLNLRGSATAGVERKRRQRIRRKK